MMLTNPGIVIEGMEGQKKKVILYNIEFTNLQDGIKSKIAKPKIVTEFFKNRDDVVLWRPPHPLNVERVYVTALIHEYIRIADDYKPEAGNYILSVNAVFIIKLFAEVEHGRE